MTPASTQLTQKTRLSPISHKRIVVEVDTGRHGKFDFVAYRSNY